MKYVYPSPLPRRQFICTGVDGIQEVFDRLAHGPLAVDTETTGLDWTRDRVGGLCFAAGDTAAFFARNALARAARWYADQVEQRRTLVFHNAKYDLHISRETFGIHVDYPVHDTLVMSRLLDNRGVPIERYPWFSRDHGLKTLAKFYVDPDAGNAQYDLLESIRARIGRHKDTMADWIVAPIKLSGKYGLRDPWYTLRLFDVFLPMIAHWPQIPGYPSLMSLYKTERWLTIALRDMEERGVLLNQDFIHRWLEKAQRRTEKLTAKMNRKAGYELNWNSNPQIRKLFWEELEIDQIDGEKMNKRVLLKIPHSLAALLLKRRKSAKMVSSGRSLLKNLGPTGRLHSHYNQNVDTGRMSATKGFHQFARDSGIREAVEPTKGLVLRSADYSQIEMRYAAHYSGEEVLIEGFINNPNFDTHAALAKRMFGLRRKQKPTPQQRDRGKTMNFSMLYGAGEDAVTEQLIDKISAEEARQSCIELGHVPSRSESPFRSLAQLLRNAVRESYPKMWQFTKDEEDIAKMMGYVTDAYGYHRWLDDDEAYKAMNSKLQGSAAHKAKEGMVAVYREEQLNRGSLAITMQVHDDIVYESDGDPKTDRRVLDLLEDYKTFKVPITADLKGSSKNWQDKESIKLPRRKSA